VTERISSLLSILAGMKDTFVRDKNEKDEIVDMVVKLIKKELEAMEREITS